MGRSRPPRAVQPFLYYCIGVGRVSSSFFRRPSWDLAPLRRGFFCEFPARCATNRGIVSVGFAPLWQASIGD